MLKSILDIFTGYFEITVAEGSRSLAASLMYEYGCSCEDGEILETGEYYFKVSYPVWRTLSDLFDDNCVEYSISEIKGLPAVIKFLTARPGLAVGIVMFVFVSVISGKVIWCYNITGNETVTDEEIILLLDELGCGYGDRISKIDFDSLHTKFLVKSDNISWISVNMKGTHANVQVRETRKGESAKFEDGVYANLVAKEDGIIKLAQVSSGVGKVISGDVVKKGELLVSGVIPVREGRVRFDYAAGEVFAYVSRSLEVKIPLETTVKSYTGNSESKFNIKIFKKSINLSLRGGIEYTTYDKIIENRQVCLFGFIPLPIWLERISFNEYEYEPSSLTPEKAVAEAMRELRYQMDDVLKDAELISSKTTTEITDEEFIIKCDLVCLCDIASAVEFSVDDESADAEAAG